MQIKKVKVFSEDSPQMTAIDPEIRAQLESAYESFNARAIEPVLRLMQANVAWPNGMEGGYVHGHAEVRAYWTRQWQMIDPRVEPVGFSLEPDGGIAVEVHQVVRDLKGQMLLDQTVRHVYYMEDGLIRTMRIENAISPRR
jgi:hypothetical protein